MKMSNSSTDPASQLYGQVGVKLSVDPALKPLPSGYCPGVNRAIPELLASTYAPQSSGVCTAAGQHTGGMVKVESESCVHGAFPEYETKVPTIGFTYATGSSWGATACESVPKCMIL